jgi:aspartyl-tRNA(Asn)/glutamyl-tRNA(Gln) amidotransferase subunit A
VSDSDLEWSSIAELGRAIRSEGLRPTRLVEHLFDRIERIDGVLGAFVSVTAERAFADAQLAEQALDSGTDLGPLHGIPYAVKDLFDVAGESTGAGTRLRADHVARADCRVVQRLQRSGMILLGKTHTVQFAADIIGINHDVGTPHNPWKRVAHVPGGSSSGSGVAVAAGFTPMALGTDTGGSVRAPAALCGTVGLKTTVGRVSRAGVHPLSQTLDSVGPLTRTVEDAALVYAALHGEDPLDASTLGVPGRHPVSDWEGGLDGLRLAFCESTFFEELDPEVEGAVRASGEVFRSLGASVESIEIDDLAEAFEMSERIDCIGSEGYAVNRGLLERHAEAVDPIVSWIFAGRDVTRRDISNWHARRQTLQASIRTQLREVDALLVPTTRRVAAPVEAVDASVEICEEFANAYQRNLSVGNYLNLCAVSLPCGFSTEGLPIGLMIYAKPFREHTALRVAHGYEKATDWNGRRPALTWLEP